MGTFFSGPKARMQAVISEGWGVGSPDPTIANRAIPAGWFLPTPNESPVEDMILSGGRFDRAYVINWTGVVDWPIPNDPFQNTLLKRAWCEITIGYVYGTPDQMGNQVNTEAGTGETPATALAGTRERALSDAMRIWRAFNLTLLYANTGTGDINPFIYGVTQVDKAYTVDLGKGRILLRLPLIVDLQGDATIPYDP